MEEAKEIKRLLEDVNLRNSKSKHYEEMTIEELSGELRNALKFERETIKKIDDFEKEGIEKDLIEYAKIVCGNVTQREISAIQDVYLEKIDTNYLK